MKKPYGLLLIACAMWGVVTWSKLPEIGFAVRAKRAEGRIVDWQVREELVQYEGVVPQQGTVSARKAVPYVNVVVSSGADDRREMRCLIVGAYSVFGTVQDYSRSETEAKLEALQDVGRLPLYVLSDGSASRCALHRFLVGGPLVFLWSVFTAVVIWAVWECFLRKRSEETAT